MMPCKLCCCCCLSGKRSEEYVMVKTMRKSNRKHAQSRFSSIQNTGLASGNKNVCNSSQPPSSGKSPNVSDPSEGRPRTEEPAVETPQRKLCYVPFWKENFEKEKFQLEEISVEEFTKKANVKLTHVEHYINFLDDQGHLCVLEKDHTGRGIRELAIADCAYSEREKKLCDKYKELTVKLPSSSFEGSPLGSISSTADLKDVEELIDRKIKAAIGRLHPKEKETSMPSDSPKTDTEFPDQISFTASCSCSGNCETLLCQCRKLVAGCTKQCRCSSDNCCNRNGKSS